MRIWQTALTTVAVGLLSVSPTHLPSCGPFPTETIYTYRVYPRFQMDRYVDGDLGVVFPTFWRRFLFVAYRHFSETPLTEGEQRAFMGERAGAVNPTKTWPEVRGTIPDVGELARVNQYRRVPESEWQSYLNCGDDAFRNAAQTLAARIEEFGANHDGVKQWVEAQDTVFSNCGDGEAIPPMAEEGLPATLAADRRYQIAAAHFYAAKLHDAERLFREIAADPSSEWRTIAPYLVARCIIRRATLDPEPGRVDLDLLSRAAHHLRQLRDNPAAKRMLDHLAVRLEPGRRVTEVAEELLDPENETRFGQNLIDFQRLMDKNAGHQAVARTGSDLVDWMVAFQAGEVDHAIKQWRDADSVAWLVAALALVGPAHDDTAELRQAAAELPPESPAYATATYHRVRLTTDTDEARALLDRLLPALRDAVPKTALNLFLAQRMALASSLDEFLQFAPRYPVGRGWGIGESHANSLEGDSPGRLFDSDSVAIINQGLPLSLLAEAAVSTHLPEELRRQLVMVTWVRAVLLEDQEAAIRMAKPLEQFYPELALDLGSWSSVGDPEQKRFAAALLLLRFPGLKPHLVTGLGMRTTAAGIKDLRDNWWCSFGLEGGLDVYSMYRYYASSNPREDSGGPPSEVPPAFLTESERTQLSAEWGRLVIQDAAPNHLAAIVTAHAGAHPDDARLPEALHLAVKSTRYGCTNQGTGQQSRAAFQLLHRRYPSSEWTRKTPYWFQ